MVEAITGNEVKDLLKANLEEIEKVLSTKTVVGEPTVIGDTTLIPLISVGFTVGAGGGSGTDTKGGAGGGVLVPEVMLGLSRLVWLSLIKAESG